MLTDFIRHILAEDIGNGDHSALACIPASAQGKARLLVKDNCTLAGIDLAQQIFAIVDPQLQCEIYLNDGDTAGVGDVAFVVMGSKRSILQAERVVLNCMQRMSGIATLTQQFVQAVAGTKARILDTRKTTPSCRYIEKWAVRIGGGQNHRMGLYDMIMIKDNHHDFCGGITPAIERANEYLSQHHLTLKIEVEVRNLAELHEVLQVGKVDRIMFDNFTPPLMEQAVQMVSRRFETEASGGITLDTVRSYALTGVDYVSVGALTHSFRSIDLSLKAL